MFFPPGDCGVRMTVAGNWREHVCRADDAQELSFGARSVRANAVVATPDEHGESRPG
jgi:hypothetical protein